MALFGKKFQDPPHEEFWSGFRDYIHEQKSSLIHFGSLYKPNELYDKYNETSYSGFEFGIEKFGENNFRDIFLVGILNPDKGHLSIKIQLNCKLNNIYEMLKFHNNSIEKHFNDDFQWMERQNFLSAGLFRRDINIKDKPVCNELYEWMRKNFELLERIFMNQLGLYYYYDCRDK